ncbi:MAG: polysaccharide deacetylase family protein [Ruminococcus sp.]|jgi:peptidoglycan-N-acetylmuramic acid deacetylase|nr:polysaccharide deacetylase family protein [Ruminococcus sp.]
MKKIILFAAAALCISVTAVSASAEPTGQRDLQGFGNIVNAAQASLDSACKGYGMGRAVDSYNRPTGAVEFNAMYGEYSAYAINEPDMGITLTFDCGYENGNTSKILDTLKEKNVKAIFFVTGDYVRKEKALINRMIAEGHIIGNHGMKHKSLPALSEAALTEEIMSLHDLVKNEFGYEMTYLRPPCGEFSEKSLCEIKNLGYTTLMWSFAYVDWEENKQPDPAKALQRITSAAHGGEIALLHAVSDTNTAILPEVIDTIRADGFDFTLPPESVENGYFGKFAGLRDSN